MSDKYDAIRGLARAIGSQCLHLSNEALDEKDSEKLQHVASMAVLAREIYRIADEAEASLPTVPAPRAA